MRFALLKGESLDSNKIHQANIDKLFSHNNSYVREILENKTPYQCFSEKFRLDAVEKLNIKLIGPEDVV